MICYGSMGQWAASFSLDYLGLRWMVTCLGWLEWLDLCPPGVLFFRIAWVYPHGSRMFSSTREEKPQSTYIFKPLLISHLLMSHWLKQITLAGEWGTRSVWLMGVITALIYQGMFQAVIPTLQSLNCEWGGLGHHSEFSGTVAG